MHSLLFARAWAAEARAAAQRASSPRAEEAQEFLAQPLAVVLAAERARVSSEFADPAGCDCSALRWAAALSERSALPAAGKQLTAAGARARLPVTADWQRKASAEKVSAAARRRERSMKTSAPPIASHAA